MATPLQRNTNSNLHTPYSVV